MGIVALQPPPYGLTSGDPSQIVHGSGDSGPQGIEAKFEFNGITLNDRDLLDTYLVTSVDGFGDADIRDSREPNPQAHGETPLAAFYGGRTLVLTGKIRAHTIQKLRDMEQGFRQAFADLTQEHPFIIRTQDTSKDLMINARKSQSISMVESQQNFQLERDFQVTLRASNPRFTRQSTQYASMEYWRWDAMSTNPGASVGTGQSVPTPTSIGMGGFFFDAGAGTLTSQSVGGYQYIMPTSTSEKRFLRTFPLRAYGGRLTQGFFPQAGAVAAAGTGIGVIVKRLDANNYLYGWLNTAASPASLEIWKCDNGTHTKLSTTSVTATLSSTGTQWIRGSISAGTITFEYFDGSSSSPVYSPTRTPTKSITYSIGSTDPVYAKYVSGSSGAVGGDLGVRWIPIDATWRLYQNLVEYTYCWGVPNELNSVPSGDATFRIINNGNFNSQPVVKMTGPMSAMMMLNFGAPGYLGGQLVGNIAGVYMFITSNATIPAGSVWTIDFAKRTIVDEAGVNRSGAISPGYSYWNELFPGMNRIEFAASGMSVGSKIEMLWQDTYM